MAILCMCMIMALYPRPRKQVSKTVWMRMAASALMSVPLMTMPFGSDAVTAGARPCMHASSVVACHTTQAWQLSEDRHVFLLRSLSVCTCLSAYLSVFFSWFRSLCLSVSLSLSLCLPRRPPPSRSLSVPRLPTVHYQSMHVEPLSCGRI